MTNDVEIGNLKLKNEFQRIKRKCEICQMIIACGENCWRKLSNDAMSKWVILNLKMFFKKCNIFKSDFEFGNQ